MSADGMLTKGLKLLVALGGYPDGVGVSELSRQVGLPVSTVHRLLATMVTLGFVRFDDAHRRYRLGLKVFELSYQVSLARGLSEVALPAMKRVADVTRESVSMSVRDDTELVYIEWAQGKNRIQVEGTAGGRGRLYCTSQGKVLLAFVSENERERILGQLQLEPKGPNTITSPAALLKELEQIRERGYAVADEENEEGIRAVGVPVIAAGGQPIAAISVVAPVFRISRKDLESFVPLLKDAAREIALQLPRAQVQP